MNKKLPEYSSGSFLALFVRKIQKSLDIGGGDNIMALQLNKA